MTKKTRRIFPILDIPIDVVTWLDSVERLLCLAAERKSAVVCICNVHMTVTATQDDELATIIRNAEMVTPDGAPLAWIMRRSGFPEQDRINGPDLMWLYLSEAEKNGQVVFFYGGKEKTLHQLRNTLLQEFPKLRIGGMISPPFSELSPEADQSYVNQINAAGTNILFVSLGCPKQEKWMQAHRNQVQAVMVGVGAAFDYHAGAIQRAPAWMQRNGLEWFYRLASEPRRLWKRYLITNTIFILKVIPHMLFNRY